MVCIVISAALTLLVPKFIYQAIYFQVPRTIFLELSFKTTLKSENKTDKIRVLSQ